MSIQLFYMGDRADPENQWCDHDEVDPKVDCDEDTLWAIVVDEGEFVGLVCDPHKDMFERVYMNKEGT